MKLLLTSGVLTMINDIFFPDNDVVSPDLNDNHFHEIDAIIVHDTCVICAIFLDDLNVMHELQELFNSAQNTERDIHDLAQDAFIDFLKYNKVQEFSTKFNVESDEILEGCERYINNLSEVTQDIKIGAMNLITDALKIIGDYPIELDCVQTCRVLHD